MLAANKEKKYFWWMAAVFLLLAVSFILDLWGQRREIIKHPSVDEKYFTKEPVRKAKLQPLLGEDGFACNDCHQDIEPSHVQKSFISAHEDIILQHGMNNYCATCHSANNKEALIDINGNDVPFEKNYLMCAKCHGTIYRDWERGVHGRMNESWDRGKRESPKLTCVACHDPHQPKFKPLEPSPAPQAVNYREKPPHE